MAVGGTKTDLQNKPSLGLQRSETQLNHVEHTIFGKLLAGYGSTD